MPDPAIRGANSPETLPNPPVTYPLRQQLLAEFIGTAALLCAVIGSGIMAETLSGGNNGVALLANTLVTVFALYVLIEILGPISGAQPCFMVKRHLFPCITGASSYTFHSLSVAGRSGRSLGCTRHV